MNKFEIKVGMAHGIICDIITKASLTQNGVQAVLTDCAYDNGYAPHWRNGLTDLVITQSGVKGKRGRAACHVAVDRYCHKVDDDFIAAL